MIKSALTALVAAIGLSGLASAALADDQNTMLDVVCSKKVDLAEVRLGWEDNCYIRGEQCLRRFTRLEHRLDGGLSHRPPTLPFHPYFLSQCALPNGTRVRVRMDEEPKQATGNGGADPSDFVTVWVGSRKVFSHSMVYAGHATENPWVAAILIAGSKLRFCVRSDIDVYGPSKSVHCSDKPPAFQNLPIKVRP